MYYIHISNSRNYQPTQYYLKLGSNFIYSNKIQGNFSFQKRSKGIAKSSYIEKQEK